MSGISTHILDTSLGRQAVGVPVQLDQLIAGKWHSLSLQMTDVDGRVKQLLPAESPLTTGTFRISFATQTYFDTQQLAGLYPLIEITFLVRDAAAHYHVPLLLTANGYSTYRGT